MNFADIVSKIKQVAEEKYNGDEQYVTYEDLQELGKPEEIRAIIVKGPPEEDELPF